MFLEFIIRKILKIFSSKVLHKIIIEKSNLLNICFFNNLLFFDNILNLLNKIRLFQLKIIIDLFGIDWLTFNKNNNNKNRFSVIYNFLSVRKFFNLFITINCSTSVNVISIYSIFKGALWLEREAWDMFGIFFFNNPDLRRILTDYGFDGFPLRKDFPLSGFFELRYDDFQHLIVLENLELSQEFRFFDFESPW